MIISVGVKGCQCAGKIRPCIFFGARYLSECIFHIICYTNTVREYGIKYNKKSRMFVMFLFFKRGVLLIYRYVDIKAKNNESVNYLRFAPSEAID